MKESVMTQGIILCIILFCVISSASSNNIKTFNDIGEINDNNPLFKEDNFTIIVLPDTQYYSKTYPDIYTNQTQWIVSHKDELNIVYVAHEGDVVNNANQTYQWGNANTSMSYLEDPGTTGLPDGIPYSVVPGNHDHPTTNYNIYFGVSRFSGREYYGGHYSTTNDNNYVLFSAADMDFIVVNLDYNPNANKINWADTLLQTYSDRRAIVISHYILNSNGSFSSIGQTIYDSLRDNSNLFLMLCGHVPGEARRTDLLYENVISALLADYQNYPNGGNGFLRIMEFCPATDEIKVTTYSPYLDQYETDEDSQFTLPYDMIAASNTLTVSIDGSGTVTKNPDRLFYWCGQEVILTAIPSNGWFFTHWSGNVTSMTNPVTLTITGNSTVTAHFNYPPNVPSITGPSTGKNEVVYKYSFNTTDSNDDDVVYYFIDWGDHTNSSWIGPYSPGEEIVKSHSWTQKGDYTIKVKAKDSYGNESDWGELSVTMPYSFNIPLQWFWGRFFQRFPNAFPILRHIMGY